jgi:hypothetical protein
MTYQGRQKDTFRVIGKVSQRKGKQSFQGGNTMPKFKSLVGVLAISTALTGGAVALGTAVSTTAASAATVMGGCGGGGCGFGVGRHGRNHNRNHLRNHQRQHERQLQHQRQHLLRDFTLVVTPFQKSDNQATPWQKQDLDTKSRSDSEAEIENENENEKHPYYGPQSAPQS